MCVRCSAVQCAAARHTEISSLSARVHHQCSYICRGRMAQRARAWLLAECYSHNQRVHSGVVLNRCCCCVPWETGTLSRVFWACELSTFDACAISREWSQRCVRLLCAASTRGFVPLGKTASTLRPSLWYECTRSSTPTSFAKCRTNGRESVTTFLLCVRRVVLSANLKLRPNRVTSLNDCTVGLELIHTALASISR